MKMEECLRRGRNASRGSGGRGHIAVRGSVGRGQLRCEGLRRKIILEYVRTYLTLVFQCCILDLVNVALALVFSQ